MNCREIQENLALYADGEMSDGARRACDEHLAICSLCRIELSEIRGVTLALQHLKKPLAPPSLAFAVKREIAAAQNAGRKNVTPDSEVKSWFKYNISPYLLGSLASLILFGAMFAALANTRNAIGEWQETARQNDEQTVKMLVSNTSSEFSLPHTGENSLPNFTLTSNQNSLASSPILLDLPSLRPQGSLSHVAASLANGNLGKKEIVVVADVFSNGIARISQVVQPTENEDQMREFERLLTQEPAFVMSKFDNRPEKVQIVLLFQKVDVYADKQTARRKK